MECSACLKWLAKKLETNLDINQAQLSNEVGVTLCKVNYYSQASSLKVGSKQKMQKNRHQRAVPTGINAGKARNEATPIKCLRDRTLAE